MTAIRTLHPETRHEIEDELDRCRQTQHWAPATVRSGWIEELEAIIDADNTGGDVDAAIQAARDEAERLATKIAEGIARDPESLREDALRAGIDDDDLPGDDATVAEMIAAVRATGTDVYCGNWGARDGWVVSADYAAATASVRDWDAGRVETVDVEVPRQEGVR